MADKITMTTPRGIAVYPRLDRPDTKFDENGTYKADLRVPADRADALIKKLSKIYRDHTGKVHPKHPERDNKNAFYYIETDEDGEETGNVVFKLRVKNKITRKGELWDRRPAQFDARGKPIRNPKRVGGGSELIVSFEVYLWQTPTGGKGMSLQPEAVQIISLEEYDGTKSADSYGFGAVEDGDYVADDDDDTGNGFTDQSGDYDDEYVPSSEDDEDDDY